MDSPGWLLLDSAAFSLDGSECNLVGSSFSAFNSEARPCVGQVGDCLRNQLLDLAEVIIQPFCHFCRLGFCRSCEARGVVGSRKTK